VRVTVENTQKSINLFHLKAFDIPLGSSNMFIALNVWSILWTII